MLFFVGYCMNNQKPLKPKQINAIQLLAVGTPAYQVAAKLEITTMTLYRWQKQPEFNSKLNYVANSGLEEVSKKMNAATLTAIETLQETMCHMGIPLAIRMKAAQIVLNNTSSINGMLEKALKHRLGDFDLKQRFENGTSYDGNGDPIQKIQPMKLSKKNAVILV